MYVRILLATLFCCATLVACSDDSSVGPRGGAVVAQYLGNNVDPEFARWYEIGDTAKIDSGFTIKFGETVFDSVLLANKQFLSISTVQWYPCYNQYLIAEVEIDNNRITIEITGVQIPGRLFLDAFKQSEVTEYFELKPANYLIEIKYKQERGSFRLKVTDSSLEVNTVRAGSFALQDSLYWRFRPMSCAIVCGMSYQDTTACSRLLDTLLSAARLTSYEYPLYGVRPFPSGSNGNYIDWGAQYFIYESEADFDRVGELLHDYGQATWAWNSGNTAYIVNYRGKQYRSWYPR